jgi:hypothetical protein
MWVFFWVNTSGMTIISPTAADRVGTQWAAIKPSPHFSRTFQYLMVNGDSLRA